MKNQKIRTGQFFWGERKLRGLYRAEHREPGNCLLTKMEIGKIVKLINQKI